MPITINAINPQNNWDRDDGNMTVTGSGFRLLARVDIVSDVNGSHINFTDTLTASPYFESSNIANGIHFNSDTSVDINASAFTNPELLDSVVTNSRRLRFYNPWSAGGVDSSGPDDQFTLSANATFAGAAMFITGSGLRSVPSDSSITIRVTARSPCPCICNT